MKKILLSLMAITALAGAGEIKDRFDEINKSNNHNYRIEQKLNLILEQYMAEEAESEARQEAIDTGIEKTKAGLKKGTNWLKGKYNEMVEDEGSENQ